MEALTQPLRNLRETFPPEEVSRMSRPRFFCFQVVTVGTTLVACFTLIIITLLSNEELRGQLLNLGQTASCLLSASVAKEQGEAAGKNWTSVLDYVFFLSRSCGGEPAS